MYSSVFLVWMIVILMSLMKMPIFTLVERKVLSYMQSRKGPNKVSFLGLLQPMSDGVKLVLKKLMISKNKNLTMFFFSPLLLFVLTLMSWLMIPLFSKFFLIMELSVLMFLCISSCSVLMILSSSWSSNSKYALIGCVRGCMQTISYEISFLTMIFFPCVLGGFSFMKFFNYNFFSLCLFVIFLVWMILIVIETNRAPFDFIEGESELVSGFNVEYSSFSFALLFLSEYGSMVIFGFVSSIFFLPIFFGSQVFFCLFFVFLFMVFRGSYPRMRMDLLSKLCWMMFLPFLLLCGFLLFLF